MKYLIWGTGKYAERFVANAKGIVNDIIGFVETVKDISSFMGKRVYSINELSNLDYDCILIASRHISEIKNEINKSALTMDKMVFLQNSWFPMDHGRWRLDKPFAGYDEGRALFTHFGVCTFSKELADKLRRDTDGSSFWKQLESYDTKTAISVSSRKQEEMLKRFFFPCLSPNDVICDYGCASGEWSRLLAPYVKRIDGFDISEKMIAHAKRVSSDKGIGNIVYSACDAQEFKLINQYDHFVMLGLLTCIKDWETVGNIVLQLADTVKNGGLLATRDTLNLNTENAKTLYTYDRCSEYFAIYHSYAMYKDVFCRNGFELLAEQYFYPYFEKPFGLGSHGFIWRKNR
ncbi:MAG: methyltransferase domain-containing protein [Kiritimatiellae bacterium]|nr:methyltransferase domain-containing protein [Kiritimatiellia bacterium]